MWGKKKDRNNTDTVWSQVIYAITQSQEVCEENTACSRVDAYVSTMSPTVLAQKHVYISVGNKVTAKVSVIIWWDREELLLSSNSDFQLWLCSQENRRVEKEKNVC